MVASKWATQGRCQLPLAGMHQPHQAMAVDSAPVLPTLTPPPSSLFALDKHWPKQILFDVPSHVLPPITVMAPAFLNPRLKSQ